MNNLGKIQSVHKASKLKQISFLSFALLCFGLFGFLTVLILREKDVSTSGLIFITGVLTIPLGLLFAWCFSQTLKNKLAIYENGLIFSDRKVTETVLWDEVISVFETVIVVRVNGLSSRNYHYAVRTNDGRKVKFSPHLRKIRQVGERLKLEAVKHNVPIHQGAI